MANCPICDRHLVEDFGLIECAQCGAALFVEFDGTVRRRDDMPQVPNANNVIGDLSAPKSDAALNLDAPVGLSPLDLGQVDLGKSTEASPELNLGADSIVSSPAPAPEEQDGPIEQQSAPPVKVASPAGTATVFGMKDLADYGNSQVSSAREGAYSYDLSIKGIDSADLRTAIKEALTDPLFLWDSEALIREARQGELKISKVTAVKAAIIVQRLKGLPVDIKWVQHGLFEA